MPEIHKIEQKIFKPKQKVERFKNFIEIMQNYAPEPFYEDIPMEATHWIFGEMDLPEDYPEEDLIKHEKSICSMENYQKGYTDSIDNCSGEFWNYHLGLGEFLENELKKEGIKVDIKLIKENWMDNADREYDEKTHIIKYEMKQDDLITTLEISREESSNARENINSLQDFLNRVYIKAKYYLIYL